MFSPRTIGAFILVVIGCLAGFDLYLDNDSAVGNTYSEIIRKWGIDYPLIPFLLAVCFGVLLTHWFGKKDKKGVLSPTKKKILVAMLMLSVFAGTLLGFLW